MSNFQKSYFFINKHSPLYSMRYILHLYAISLLDSKYINKNVSYKTFYNQNKLKSLITKMLFHNRAHMQSLISNKEENKSSFTLDCFEKLKVYYKYKPKWFEKGRKHFKEFYMKRKELKYDLKEWKVFLRNGIISLFLTSNLIYLIKHRKSDKIFIDTFNFIKYSSVLCLMSNFLAQKQLNSYYKTAIYKT